MNKKLLLESEPIHKENLAESDYHFESMWKNSPQIVIPIACAAVCVLSFLIFYVWKYVRIQRNKASQLKALTPKQTSAQLYAGIKASQPIQFVVPTITMKSTETSYSVTEESDSDCLMQFGYNSDYNTRTRKRNSRIQINENEISKGLYDDFVSKPIDSPEVNVVLHYSFMRQQLLVTILSAKNLPMKRNHLNPFAKVVLMPDKSPKFVTKVQKNNANPIFNELFIFHAMRETLSDRTLKISLYSSDSFSRKSLIGRSLYPLKNAGIHSEITNDVMTEDINCILSNQISGELLISLTYQPNTSTLTLGVLKARNICHNEIQTAYVKVVLFLKRKRIRSRKTPLRKIQQEIEFNDTFHVHVASDALNDIIIGIAIYGKSAAFVNKHLLGRTHVGESCLSPQGRQHWADMLNNFNSSVNQWHTFS